MAVQDLTKKLLADTLQSMLKSTPLYKIHIKDLCAVCGVNRQTFYYHFHDKYELISWIYIQDYNAAWHEVGCSYNEKLFCRMLEKMYEKHSFYKRVFDDSSQNCLREYMIKYHVENDTNAVVSYRGCDDLTLKEKYEIRSYAFSCVAHIIEWISDRSPCTIQELARLEYTFMPDILKHAYYVD